MEDKQEVINLSSDDDKVDDDVGSDADLNLNMGNMANDNQFKNKNLFQEPQQQEQPVSQPNSQPQKRPQKKKKTVQQKQPTNQNHQDQQMHPDVQELIQILGEEHDPGVIQYYYEQFEGNKELVVETLLNNGQLPEQHQRQRQQRSAFEEEEESNLHQLVSGDYDQDLMLARQLQEKEIKLAKRQEEQKQGRRQPNGVYQLQSRENVIDPEQMNARPQQNQMPINSHERIQEDQRQNQGGFMSLFCCCSSKKKSNNQEPPANSK